MDPQHEIDWGNKGIANQTSTAPLGYRKGKGRWWWFTEPPKDELGVIMLSLPGPSPMNRRLKLIGTIYILFFVASGTVVSLMANGLPSIQTYKGFFDQIFEIHLACWMILGMGANYFWDLFREGKGWESFQLPKLLLPLLVSPIVFYPTWSLWLGSKQDTQIIFELIAFQNGFFWQALFSKAGPITK